MMVTAFLRTPLFVLTGPEHHAPEGVSAVVGQVVSREGGITMRVTRWLDGRGRELEGPSRTLFLPAAKLDHVWHHEA